MGRAAALVIILLLLGFLPQAPLVEAKNVKSVSIEPTDDTWIAESGYVDTRTYRLSVGTYNGQENRAYLKFDLRGKLPTGAVVVGATLRLHAYYHRGDLPHNISVYGVLDDSWDELTLRWDNQPTAATGPLDWELVKLPYGNVDEDYFWDVTDFVLEQLAVDGVVSFYLTSNNSKLPVKDYIYFTSKDSYYTDQHPLLIVHYYVPVYLGSISVDEPVYSGSETVIRVFVGNDGSGDVNVTLRVLVNGAELYADNVTVPVGGSSFQVPWLPLSAGEYRVFAEITGQDIADSASTTVYVRMNPYRLFYGLSILYMNRYAKLAPQLDEAYANFTSAVEELKECGIDLGDLSGDVAWIEENYNLTKSEYSKFLTLRQRVMASSGAYVVMLRARRAVFLAQEVLERIEQTMPVLNRYRALCNGTQVLENETVETLRITRVLIDLSHGQYYFTKYGFQGLRENIEGLGWEVHVNRERLTPEKLEGYSVVILANPKTPLTASEVRALREYVENGGALFVTGDWYRYVNVESLNQLLEGTGVQFEKTELMDDEVNSGKPYYPFVGIYNRDCSITRFIPDGWKMYYNGDTIAVDGDAKWVIRGFESSYAVDDRGNVVHERGSQPIVAAAVTFGEGKIVVYGSSRALSDAYYGKYIKSNWPFIKGALLWLVEEG